jgi:hypothetical protein
MYLGAHTCERDELERLKTENADLRKQADYAHRLICDWWKPQSTSQEVHRQYALAALANPQDQPCARTGPRHDM